MILVNQNQTRADAGSDASQEGKASDATTSPVEILSSALDSHTLDTDGERGV